MLPYHFMHGAFFNKFLILDHVMCQRVKGKNQPRLMLLCRRMCVEEEMPSLHKALLSWLRYKFYCIDLLSYCDK